MVAGYYSHAVFPASLPPLQAGPDRTARPRVVVVAVIVLVVVVCARLLGLAADIEAWVRVDRLVPQAALSAGATGHEVTVERVTGAVIGLAVLLTDAIPGSYWRCCPGEYGEAVTLRASAPASSQPCWRSAVAVPLASARTGRVRPTRRSSTS